MLKFESENLKKIYDNMNEHSWKVMENSIVNYIVKNIFMNPKI